MWSLFTNLVTYVHRYIIFSDHKMKVEEKVHLAVLIHDLLVSLQVHNISPMNLGFGYQIWNNIY